MDLPTMVPVIPHNAGSIAARPVQLRTRSFDHGITFLLFRRYIARKFMSYIYKGMSLKVQRVSIDIVLLDDSSFKPGPLLYTRRIILRDTV
jgi:hypothetical protein